MTLAGKCAGAIHITRRNLPWRNGKPETEAPSQATGLVISAILLPSSFPCCAPNSVCSATDGDVPVCHNVAAAPMRTLVHNYPYTKSHPDFRCLVCEWTYNLAHRSFVLDYLEGREARRAFDAHNCSDFSPT